MPEVLRRGRTVTDGQLRAALAEAGGPADDVRAPLILSHWVIETGRFPINNNLGNITVPAKVAARAPEESPPFWRPPWYEVTAESSDRNKRLHERMLKGQAPSAFRAYDTLADGARAYLGLLERDNYDELRTARTPRAFLEAAKSTGYTPDLDIENTLPGFGQLYAHFGGMVERAGTRVSADTVALGAAILGALLWATRK